mmetsp:Transcript_34583/g.88749  ORF Transcript_34583/g.88749 Transcript_34583/m.88749 type:complete len:279 (+) Transcript_34583:122-958(+)
MYCVKMQAVMPGLFWPLSSTITMMLLAVGVQLTIIATIQSSSCGVRRRLSAKMTPVIISGWPTCFMTRMPMFVASGTAWKSQPFERFVPSTIMFTGTDADPIACMAWKRKASGVGMSSAPGSCTNRRCTGGTSATRSPSAEPTTGGTRAFLMTLRTLPITERHPRRVAAALSSSLPLLSSLLSSSVLSSSCDSTSESCFEKPTCFMEARVPARSSELEDLRSTEPVEDLMISRLVLVPAMSSSDDACEYMRRMSENVMRWPTASGDPVLSRSISISAQ